MELKDVILSTLAEMENDTSNQTANKNAVNITDSKENGSVKAAIEEISQIDEIRETPENELMFLNSIRERLLVLFEGFQAPNNSNIEAKIDLTLNFLEYVLSMIDNRLESLKKGK